MSALTRRRALHGAAAVILGCSSRDGSAPLRPSRVVTTAPSMTEIVFAIGRGSALVGRSRFCDFPPEAAAVPVVGGFSDPSVEKIVSLEPTLVCGERGPAGPELPGRLESLGIATFFPEMDDTTAIGNAFVELARRLGVTEQGERAKGTLESDIDRVRKDVASLSRQRVLFVFDWQPIVAAGPASFPDQLLRIAGGENVVKEGEKYPRLGAEAVFALDPDVIVDGSGHGAAEPTGPSASLASLRAVKAGRVRALASAAALRPGPRLGAGIQELARLVHGGAS